MKYLQFCLSGRDRLLKCHSGQVFKGKAPKELQKGDFNE